MNSLRATFFTADQAVSGDSTALYDIYNNIVRKYNLIIAVLVDVRNAHGERRDTASLIFNLPNRRK
jgi:hypothetical protein